MLGRFSKLILVGVAIWGASHVSAQTQAEKAILELMSDELIPEFLPKGSSTFLLDESAIQLKLKDILHKAFRDRANVQSLLVTSGLEKYVNTIYSAAEVLDEPAKSSFIKTQLAELIKTKERVLIEELNKICGHVLEFYPKYALRENGSAYSKEFASADDNVQASFNRALKNLASKYHTPTASGRVTLYRPKLVYVDDFSEALIKTISKFF